MILIKNGLVVDPATKTEKKLDIIVKNSKIYDIGNFDISDDYTEIIDAKGCVVAPGLIDVHVHFREPGFEYKEDVHTGSNAAKKGGFTTVVCMANTNPVVDNIETLKSLRKIAEEMDINVLNVATITKGFSGKDLTDMALLKENGAAGFSDDGIAIMDTKVLLDAMNRAKSLNVPISLHEEDPALIGVAGVNDGEVAAALGIKGAPAVSEDVMVARDCMLALHSGAKVNIQHLSSKNSVAVIRLAKELGANVTAEVTPQHFSKTEKLVTERRTLAKVNPPIRTEDHRQALIAGLKDGTIDMIATDHAPHASEEKEREFSKAPSGLIGLETALALGITYLVKEGHLTIMELLEKLTVNPAKLYNLDTGTIQKEYPADIVIFSPDSEWTVGEDFASKSKNSPFIGDNLYGEVRYTICDGNIVYRNVK